MDLLIAANTVTQPNSDIAPATGTPGWATDGDPTTNTQATQAPAWHYNMMMAEMLAIVKAAGITPSNADWSQVLKAMQTIFAPTQRGVAPYSAALAQLIGGYPKDAVVVDASGVFWKSTADKNMTAPSDDGALWVSFFDGFATQDYVQGKFALATNVFKNEVIITDSGNFVVPKDVTTIEVTVIGGGGGGGGASATNEGQISAASGGGGGGAARSILTVVPGTVYAVTIGGGGDGGGGSNTGGGLGGGTSSFGTALSATGGGGGQPGGQNSSNVAYTLTGGGAGQGVGGAMNIPGSSGGSGYGMPGNTSGGSGGGSLFGGGAGPSSENAQGNTGAFWGCGGGGANTYTNQGGKSGGAGSPGVVIVRY